MLPFVQRKWMVGTMLEGELPFCGMGQLRWATLFTRRFSCPSSFVRPADEPTEVIVFGKQKDGEGFFWEGLG